MDEFLRVRLETAMWTESGAYPGVRFPAHFFRQGTLAERVAAFDAAYDLACRTLGLTTAEVMDEQDHLRFVPARIRVPQPVS